MVVACLPKLNMVVILWVVVRKLVGFSLARDVQEVMVL